MNKRQIIGLFSTAVCGFAIAVPASAADQETAKGQPPQSATPTDDVDDIFRSVFGKERPEIAAGLFSILIDGINVGEYDVVPDSRTRKGSVDSKFVTNILAVATVDETAKKLKELANGRDKIDFELLREMGLTVQFDSTQLVLRIDVPLEIRSVRDLNLRGNRGRTGTELVKRSDFSAFASVRAGVTLIEDSAIANTGFQRFAADIDLAANILGVAITADLRYDTIRNRKFSRGDVRLTYDDRNSLIRYELGDLSVGRRPFQNAPQIAGISAFRNFSINPYLNIRPTSEQAFELTRPARVEIFVNGTPVRSFDLRSGRYNLRDFPLISSAGNDIELRINYGSGEIEVRIFPAFFDLELLAPGLLDFAVNIGLPYEEVDGIRRYDDQDYNGTAYARFGLSPTVTAGINWEGSRNFDLVGGELIWASPVGTFGINASTNIRKPGSDSSKLTMQYRWRDTDRDRERSIDGLISFTGKDYRTLNDIFSGNFIAKEARLRVGQKINSKLRGQVTAGYEEIREGNRTNYFVGLDVSRQFRFGSIYAGVEYRKSQDGTGPTARIGLTLPLGRSSVTSSYMTQDNSARLEYSRLSSVGVNSLGFSAGAERRDGSDRQYARANFIGNRFDASVQQIARNYLSDKSQQDMRTEFNLGTALVFAGGQLAISPPVRDSFAIFKANKKAGDHQIAVEPRTSFGSSETKYSAFSGALGPAVITSLTPYFNRTVQVDAPDAPAGTSLGGQVYELNPGFRSGYFIEVGTAANVSVIGNMLDKDGDPFVYASGEATLLNPAKDDIPLAKPIFTNATGRFFLEGVEAGRTYRINISVDGRQVSKEMAIPDDVAGMYRVGDYQFFDVDVPAKAESAEKGSEANEQ